MATLRTLGLCVLLIAPVALCAACASESDEAVFTPATNAFPAFSSDVYPVLLRDCGFPACHGAEDRLFRVWGPGRTRLLDPEDTGCSNLADPNCEFSIFDPPTGDERGLTWASAKAMIDPFDPENSLLLRKPLSVGAGGAAHEGVDRYGRDVYRTLNDSGYRTIEAWATDIPPPAPPPPAPTP